MTLLYDILSDDNIQKALETITNKSDVPGPDGLRPSQLGEYWESNSSAIIDMILSGEYEPTAVKQFEQLNKRGKKRKVTQMCVVDKLLARASLQVLTDILDTSFSDRCFGYRRNKSTKDMAYFAADSIKKGNIWVVEIDIQDFFDSISHEKLERAFKKLIADEKLCSFVMSYVSCRIENEEGVFRLARGILQGSPLSPLLSNIFLRSIDSFGQNVYAGYCRYGDDIRVYTQTKGEGESILREIECLLDEYDLSINNKKSGVFIAEKRPCLGYELICRKSNVLIKPIQRSNKEIYHKWTTSALKEIDHNYHIISDGILTKKDFTILFENEDEKKYIPIESIDTLNIYANVIFSSNFFEMANDVGLCVSIVNKYGELIGRFTPQRWKGNLTIEAEQIRLLGDEKRRLALAKEFQIANVFNIRANLRYYARRNDNEVLDKTINEISDIIRKINEAKTINILMMYEAEARQKYYRCFNIIMSGDSFRFNKRTRRPPQDALNAMISYGNTLLYTRFANLIYQSSLDIRIGILHNSVFRAESLNLDLADLFKPVIVDRTIFTIVNKKMINEVRDFEEGKNGGIYMSYYGKRIFIKEFERKVSQVMMYKGKKMSYSDIMIREVKEVNRYFRDGTRYKPYRYVN